jgi:hypothetical protein
VGARVPLVTHPPNSNQFKVCKIQIAFDSSRRGGGRIMYQNYDIKTLVNQKFKSRNPKKLAGRNDK